MGDMSALRKQAREAIQAGKLPNSLPRRIWAAPGCGTCCTICGRPAEQDEVDLEFSRDGDGRDPGNHHVHVECFAAWEFEHRNFEAVRGSASSSGGTRLATSPSFAGEGAEGTPASSRSLSAPSTDRTIGRHEGDRTHNEARRDCAPETLGDLLYADKAKTPVSEKGWLGLVQSIGEGDQRALRALYERVHRLVFTLIMRITNNRETAEECALDVFHDVWRRAKNYDAAGGSVVGWIMNQARSRAIDRLRLERRKKPHAGGPLPPATASDSDKLFELSEQRRRLRNGLHERRAIKISFWPIDVLLPEPLWGRLAHRIAAETRREPVLLATQPWCEPEWEEVAPGITCKLLATDTEQDRVSMLVRLAPGVDYPPHAHAGVEELYLLNGELWIDHRKLYPGDYNRAEPGTADTRVWSDTGCTCVLITSTRHVIR
jgi:RNA polymerase sigma factor (sigma-70 family)